MISTLSLRPAVNSTTAVSRLSREVSNAWSRFSRSVLAFRRSLTSPPIVAIFISRVAMSFWRVLIFPLRISISSHESSRSFWIPFTSFSRVSILPARSFFKASRSSMMSLYTTASLSLICCLTEPSTVSSPFSMFTSPVRYSTWPAIMASYAFSSSMLSLIS